MTIWMANNIVAHGKEDVRFCSLRDYSKDGRFFYSFLLLISHSICNSFLVFVLVSFGTEYVTVY